MKRVQPAVVHSQQHTVRRVIQQRDPQAIAVNKINNLPSVSVSTQPSQRIVRQTVYGHTQHSASNHKCFICDETILGQATSLTDSETVTSRERVTKKLAKMVGDDFCVIVSEDDVICRRCLTLFNTMDKYEFDLENVRSRLRGFINKKYSIDDEEPPTKIQKLSVGREAAESQLKTLATTPKRGPVKLYKCIACDFKTTDLQAFQPHSNVCKGQVNKNSVTPRPQIRPSPAPVQRATPPTPQLQCRSCQYKTTDRLLFQEHQRNHMKLRPFKCRMCLERFETREAAQTHAKIHTTSGNLGTTGFKCSICSRQFSKRELYDAHVKTHDRFKSVSQQEVIVMNKKPLQEIIKEALSEDDGDAVNELIEFHSCNLCSLTFVNKKLYAQHMKTHESKTVEKPAAQRSQEKSQDTLGDLESIFEKMHSEGGNHKIRVDNGVDGGGDKNVLITTQEGGITYNITIPQDDAEPETEGEKSVRISMPNLDSDETQVKSEVVSMPSLHDEENTQSSQEVPMELEDGEGQQLKFIVDENGQFLQLDNHILTTDEEGNQILVQGTDQEQLQHLLQSVGVDGNQVLVQLQGNGEGMEMENQGQMILVQGADGESQLIDASMLQTEDGNLVLQQGEDGQTHLTTADGIPVSVSFTGEGGDGQITVTMASGHEDGQQIFLQQPMEVSEGQEAPAEEAPAAAADANVSSTTDTEVKVEETPAEESAVKEESTAATDAAPEVVEAKAEPEEAKSIETSEPTEEK